MNSLSKQPWEEDLISPQETEDVLERLSKATDVLDLLRRADEISPSEINLWSALVLNAEEDGVGDLYVHSPAPIAPALALALAESMHGELSGCCPSVSELNHVRQAGMSCANLGSEVVCRMCDAFHDQITHRGENPVGVSRAGALAADGLTLQRWREADRALEVTAWMLGALTDEQCPTRGIIDPVTGQYSQAFFEHLLHNELARHERSASELSLVLMQMRRSASMLADEKPPPELLATTGAIMREELRQADVVARLDARRLAALLPCTSPRNGLIAATRLGEALQDAGALEGWSIDIGVSGMGMDMVGPSELLDQATHAMLSASEGAAGHPFVYV